jgi:2-polyprenyl-6-methoxyphenol hydroxylase-like FAD-dependent oxidoreductase
VKSLDVGVIGCGTAGAAAALFLARAGHRVTVYEDVDDPRAVGAGIMLQPIGMHVLARLGLVDEVVARGAHISRLHCVTSAHHMVTDISYADLDPAAFGVGLHRGVLFSKLYAAVKEQRGITLHCGKAIERTEREKGTTYLVDEDGRRRGPHELVVAADGARSRVRAASRSAQRAREYPWGALWFIGEDPDRVFDDVLFQVVEGTSVMLGLLPSGLGPEGETPRVSLFWSIRGDRVDAWRARGIEPWKEQVLRYEPRTEALLAQIDSTSEMLYARYFDVILDPWHQDDVVFLGDAAHAMSPQLGQGANLALVDAMVLADCVAEAEHVETALDAYSHARRDHLAYYQWATRFLTPFFQSDVAILGMMRDTFMGLSSKVPFVREKMIRTMCGLERGIVIPDALALPELPKLLPKEAAAE